MTNRISELFESCGVYLAPDNPKVARKEIDFFAEQIVRECIKEIAHKSVELLDTEFAAHYNLRLKKHFGVK